MEREKYAILDLDGTLLHGNSLWMFIIFILKKLGKRRKFVKIFELISLLVARKMHLINHVRMKYAFHAIGEHLNNEEMDEFVTILSEKLNTKLLNEIQKRDYKIILASAAPFNYCNSLSEKLGFDNCIATSFVSTLSEYTETRSEAKRDKVLRYVNERGCEIGIVITDHKDDMPLLRLDNIERLLVDPDSNFISDLQKEGLSFHIFGEESNR